MEAAQNAARTWLSEYIFPQTGGSEFLIKNALAIFLLTHTREARRRALEEAAAIAETAGTTTTEFRDGNQVTRTTLDRAAIAAAIRARAQEGE